MTIQGIIGKKLGMSEIYGEDGKIAAVTSIEAGPCTITQVKSVAKEGYNSVQLGFGQARKIKSAQQGVMPGSDKLRYLRELRVDNTEGLEVGQKIDVGLFKPGDLVNVTGVTKGKGFAGVVKRYHFKGGPKTHGQSDRERHPGAIGSTTTPGRVLKGRRMAGHMGNEQLTTRNLKVVMADPARNLLVLKGPVPGGTNGLLIIKKAKAARSK